MAKDSSGKRMPWFRMWSKDFMAEPAIQGLSWDQRGRYVWALMCSWETDDPGVGLPWEHWGRWMGYSMAQWDEAEHVYDPLFKQHPRMPGVWMQDRMQREYVASREVADRRSASSRKANTIRWDSERTPNGYHNGLRAESPSVSESVSEESKSTPLSAGADWGLVSPNGNTKKRKPKQQRVRGPWGDAFFEQFWPEWLKLGRECSKASAYSAWEKIPHGDIESDFNQLMDAFESAVSLWRSENRRVEKYPHAATWLNDYHRNLVLEDQS